MMRILFVADEYPWPPRTGYRQRIVGIVTALAQFAEVDVFTVVPEDTKLAGRPRDAPVVRLAAVPTTPRRGNTITRLHRWIFSRRPRSLLWRNWEEPRTALRNWANRDYDVVWFSHATSYLAMGDLLPAPQIVDLDNLTSSTLRHRRVVRLSKRPRTWLPAVLAHAVADTVDARRWRRAEEEIAATAEAVVVCSDLDRARLGQPNTTVVPNGYEPPSARREDPLRREQLTHHESGPSRSRVLLMVGLLRYEPNRDGAAFFAQQVLPLVRATIPDVEFRVVGQYDNPAQIAGLRGVPGVTVTGEIEDLAATLRTADAAVIPIRFGGGTRIKVLEAFAWGLPVVSTSVGAEGLAVVDGEHLLIADDPYAIAQACLRVLTDDQLRSRLVAAAEALWAERYSWAKVSEQVRAAVLTVADAAGRA